MTLSRIEYDYTRILQATGYTDEDIRKRSRDIERSSKRFIVANILFDMGYLPRQICGIIDRDRSSIYYYIYTIRHQFIKDIIYIEQQMGLNINK